MYELWNVTSKGRLANNKPFKACHDRFNTIEEATLALLSCYTRQDELNIAPDLRMEYEIREVK